VISKRGQELNGTDEKQSPHQDVEKIKLNGAHYCAEGSLFCMALGEVFYA
jgi:hypothetical protein